jgi:hypothetical protein
VDVAELPVDRNGDGRRELVGGEHPRVAAEAAEVGDDVWERRRHEVERSEQERD